MEMKIILLGVVLCLATTNGAASQVSITTLPDQYAILNRTWDQINNTNTFYYQTKVELKRESIENEDLNLLKFYASHEVTFETFANSRRNLFVELFQYTKEAELDLDWKIDQILFDCEFIVDSIIVAAHDDPDVLALKRQLHGIRHEKSSEMDRRLERFEPNLMNIFDVNVHPVYAAYVKYWSNRDTDDGTNIIELNKSSAEVFHELHKMHQVRRDDFQKGQTEMLAALQQVVNDLWTKESVARNEAVNAFDSCDNN